MHRNFLKSEHLDASARKQKDLKVGDSVYIQDQDGPSPRKWSKSGVAVETLPYNCFIVKVDGT